MELLFPRLVQETRPPLSSDDALKGYIAGQNWMDTNSQKYYVCVCNTENAAVWRLCSYDEGTGCCGSILDMLEQILEALSGGNVNVLTPDFTFSPNAGSLPLNVAFTDTSTATGSTIVSYLWTFGDGGTSQSKNPNHSYTTSGVFDVTLTITDSNGKTKTKTKENIIDTTTSFFADFTLYPSSGAFPLSVYFDNTSSGENITGIYWTFGDGNVSHEDSPTHVYTGPGLFDVTLEITNDLGVSKTKTIQDAVNATSGISANFISDKISATTVPTTINFTNTSSGNNIVNYLWEFGDGTTSQNQNPSHTYNSFGTYSVKLTITDGSGNSDSETKTNFISVTQTSSANFTASQTTGQVPTTVAFTNTSVGSFTSCQWTFGDGSTSQEVNPSHTYTQVGVYDVTLVATTAAGVQYTKTKTSFINVISAGDPQIIDPNLQSFLINITNWQTGSWSIPTGWTAIKDLDDTALKITHNLANNPEKSSLVNTGLDPDVFVPYSDVTKFENIDNNMGRFTQCEVGETFKSYMLFDYDINTQNTKNKILIYRLSITDFANSIWAAPQGWTISKINSNTGLKIIHNLNKDITYWESQELAASFTRNVFILNNNSFNFTKASSSNASTIDFYFIKT